MRRSLPALVAVLALALAACARPALPIRLAGLHRAHVWSGERAARLMANMHGRDVAPRSSVVAEYGREGELRVFLSVYPKDEDAGRVLARMLEAMRSGGTPFTPPGAEDGSGRWATFGPGGHHILWVSHSRLYWLQGLPDAVEQAAAELPAPTPGVWT